MLSADEVERVLVVAAHPDDIDFGVSGTVALWVKAGVEVSYCVITDGDAGGFDPAVPREQIGGIRRREQRAAAEVVGVSDVTFLGYPDGRLTVSLELRRDIARVIRRVRPQRVVTQSGLRDYAIAYASHPDHLAAGEATMCAVYPDARNPFAHPGLLADEGLPEWAVPEVWVIGGAPGCPPNHAVDITDVFELKKQALLAHASQMVSVPDLDAVLVGWNGENARRAGLPDGRLAEAFFVADTA